MRTIYVVYTNCRLSARELRACKEYMFLCPYDVIKVGDMIKDNRYSTTMQVTKITNCSQPVQNGICLKQIQINELNGQLIFDYNQIEAKVINSCNEQIMEDRRNVAITLEEAREWYKSNNSALKAIALKAYSEDELVGYEYMVSKVSIDAPNMITPCTDVNRFKVLHKLAVIATYFNSNWKMSADKTGYFIGKSNMGGSSTIAQVDLTNNIAVYEHRTVCYAGIVYFKNAEDAKKAGKMLGSDLCHLFD